MGTIKKLKENNLVNGVGEEDVYPITSTRAVFNDLNEDLDTIFRLIDTNNIKIFSGRYIELDNYNTKDKCNLYRIIQNNEFGGILIISELSNNTGVILFLIGSFYINPETGTLDGKMGAVSYDVKPNIVCRKYVNDEWSKWQYYQETFLTNDGSGTNTLVAPTLKYLIELYYTKTEINDNFIKKDSVNAVRNISINQLSDLDTYTPYTKSGIYNVLMYGGTKYVGVLYVYNFQAPQHGGLQVFLSTFNYNNPWQSSLTMPSIIYRMFDLDDGERWEPWKPYQTTFISNDGTVPENGGAIGLNETNMAPSLSFLLKKTDYLKVVEWSGIVEDDAEIEDAGTGLEGLIVYIVAKNTFAYKVQLPYGGGTAYYAYFDGLEKFQNKRYDSSPDFVADFTKNIFKGADGSIWIADSATSIRIVNIKDAPLDGNTYGRSDGLWKRIESAGTITIDSELSESSTNPILNRVITSELKKNTIREWSGIVNDVDFTPEMQSVNDVTTDEIEYSSIKKQFFVNRIFKKYLAFSGEGFTSADYANQDGVFRGIDGSLSVFNQSGELVRMTVGSDIYRLPGDITAGFTGSNYDEVLGTYPEFKAAYDAGKIFISKGIYLKVTRIEDYVDLYDISFSYYSDGSLRYAYITMNADGSNWTDDPTNDTYSIKGTIV